MNFKKFRSTGKPYNKYDEGDQPETSLQDTLSSGEIINSSDISIKTNIKSRTPIEYEEPSEYEIQIEPECITPKVEDDTESVSVISASSLPHWQIQSERKKEPTEVQVNGINNDDEQYETMSLDALKRTVLIAETKMLKAQEDAARAKEQLNLYKLELLKRRNGDI